MKEGEQFHELDTISFIEETNQLFPKGSLVILVEVLGSFELSI